MHAVIQKVTSNKAPGMNRVPYEFFKYAPKNFLNKLIDVYGVLKIKQRWWINSFARVKYSSYSAISRWRMSGFLSKLTFLISSTTQGKYQNLLNRPLYFQYLRKETLIKSTIIVELNLSMLKIFSGLLLTRLTQWIEVWGMGSTILLKILFSLPKNSPNYFLHFETGRTLFLMLL